MLNNYPINSPCLGYKTSGFSISRSGTSIPQGSKIRKRGGQPGNSNAFRHGLYSSLTPCTYPIPLKSLPIQKDPSVLLKDLHDRLLDSGKKVFLEYRHQLAYCLAASKGRQPYKEILSQARAATMIVGKMQKISRTLFELGGRQSHLRSLVRDLPALLRWEFSEMGIPVQPVFVPQKLGNLHTNLSWESPRLTDSQWELLQGPFVSLRADRDSFRKYRRRKPMPPDRFLLEGIFWKLANGLRRRDLAGKYPPRRCQELYHALRHSGHMQTIFDRLQSYLDTFGGSTASLSKRSSSASPPQIRGQRWRVGEHRIDSIFQGKMDVKVLPRVIGLSTCLPKKSRYLFTGQVEGRCLTSKSDWNIIG